MGKSNTAGEDAVKNTVSKTYTVQRGDTLDKIANNNGISLNKICEKNKLAKDDNIHTGQVIIVK